MFPSRSVAAVLVAASAAAAQEMGISVINGIRTEGEIWRGVVLVRGVGGCSGSFIGPNLVLTAAHCCDNNAQDGIQIFGGADGEIDFGFSEKHEMAPGNGFTYLNDMCLVQLQNPKPDSFPHYDLHITNVPFMTDSVIVGYGLNETSIIPGGEVGFGEARYGLTRIQVFTNRDIQVTARPGTDPMQNACNGDSGGPVFAPTADGEWKVHGVTSRGMPGCPASVFNSAYYNNAVPNEKFLEDTATSWGVGDLNGIGNCESCCTEYEC